MYAKPRVAQCYITQFLWEKNKLETTKEPQYIPKWIPGSEVVDPDCWIKLCTEYKDLYGEPGNPVEQVIKHQIDLLNPNAPVKHHK